MEVDHPEAVAAVLVAFERYEAALVANDLDTVDELMWHDDRTVRVGVDDRQDGFEAISTFRRSQSRQTPPRALRDTVVVTFGADAAVVTTSFVPDDGTAVGRQQQTWVRFDGRWRIVGAHVSLSLSGIAQALDHQT